MIEQVRFDEQGDVDPAGETALMAALETAGATDLIVFSHGWNNSVETASRLYAAFFEQVDNVLASRGTGKAKAVRLGVFWPSQRWTDEPIPDFAPAPDLTTDSGGGAAGLGHSKTFPPPPVLDDDAAELIKSAFPASAQDDTNELVKLLQDRPDDQQALDRARTLIAKLSEFAGLDGDGERGNLKPVAATETTDKNELFREYTLALEGLRVTTSAGSGGGAGFKDQLGKLWHGAQEAARQATYWQMKKRAGVVGEHGLGPLLARVLEKRPTLKLHLVGHSFGGRVVSYALRALPATVDARPPVASLTLLQAAFSHFAFAETTEFGPGALAGEDVKVSGPVIACFSKYDSAVGTFYPLASMAALEDTAAFADHLFRWGGLGHDGHQKGVEPEPIHDIGQAYDFAGESLYNIDASKIVCHGSPPSGAHSDIVHDRLAYVVLNAGGLVS